MWPDMCCIHVNHTGEKPIALTAQSVPDSAGQSGRACTEGHSIGSCPSQYHCVRLVLDEDMWDCIAPELSILPITQNVKTNVLKGLKKIQCVLLTKCTVSH